MIEASEYRRFTTPPDPNSDIQCEKNANHIRAFRLRHGDSFFMGYTGYDYKPGEIIEELGGFMITRVHYEKRRWFEFFKKKKITGYDVTFIGG